MKKYLKIALLVAAVAAALSITALAASPTDAGMYNVGAETGYRSTVTIAPQTTTAAATAASVDMNGATVADFYSGAVKLNVTYSAATANDYYLVFALSGDSAVPTAANIKFIDQDKATTTTVTFNVYPSELTSGQTYSLYLASNDGTLTTLTKIGHFSYYAPYLRGNADDSDNVITVVDSLYALQIAVGQRVPTGNQLLEAEVDGDTTSITVVDALYILQYAVGQRTTWG